MRLLRPLFVAPDRRVAIVWRLLSYVVAFLLVVVLTAGLGEGLEAAGIPELLAALTAAPIYVAAIVGMTIVWRRYLDRRPWSGMALPPPRAHWQELGAGFGLGGGLIALVFLVEWALGWASVSGWEGSGGILHALGPLVAGLVTMAAVGFGEELAFRGYVFQNLGERMPIWAAVTVCGLLFGLLHASSGGFGPALVASALLVTTFLVLTRLLTGNLWLAIGWHWGWNWAQNDVFGLSQVDRADRGDALLHLTQRGPHVFVGTPPAIEGGLLAILAEATGLVLLLIWARRHGASIRWRARLAPDGRPLAESRAGEG
jgi:membrane protease YdiL (CAAX protease family)